MNSHLKNLSLELNGYQIVPIREEDIELIRIWRNEQMEILRQQKQISFEEQQTYFREVIQPTFEQKNPKQLLFSFLLDHECIGYGGLTYIDWNSLRAEVSFLVNPIRILDKKIYRNDFLHFLELLCQFAFQTLGFHRLFGETFAFRHDQIELLEEYGFKREGALREHVYKRHQWDDSIMHGLLSHEWAKYKAIGSSGIESNVLVTSISKKMPMLNSVKIAAKKSKKFSKVHGCDSDPLCIGQYGVDQFWYCPPLNQLTLEEIISYCTDNQIIAIIPSRDADLEFFALHALNLAHQGIHVMVSPLESILTCLDKKAFADALLKHHFPAIPTLVSIDECVFPSYVVKERKGAGSRQIGLGLTREFASQYSKKLNEPIFQPFIEGKEWSIDIYRSFKGRIQGCVARVRNYVVNGESQVTTTMHTSALEKLCSEMADQLNLYGHAVFQCIEDVKGDFHVIECNPRFGGASTASLAVGLDSFFWFLMECKGENLKNYPFHRSTGEIQQIRYQTDRIIPWSSSST